MQILKLINSASKFLKEKNIQSNKLDSELLLSKVLNKKREELLLKLDENVSKHRIIHFEKLIYRRSLKEPIAYILKQKEFWSKNFMVNKNTLIPRPETELMVEKIQKIFKNKSLFILDIGTGSGCILLSLLSELKSSKGIGIDISKKAIQIAVKNSKICQMLLLYLRRFLVRQGGDAAAAGRGGVRHRPGGLGGRRVRQADRQDRIGLGEAGRGHRGGAGRRRREAMRPLL